MSLTIDDWMHASDEERLQTIQSWNTDNNEGADIAKYVASIFTDECVYEVTETRASIKNGNWVIETFSEGDNYDALNSRKNINFLGFDIVFSHIDNL